jgi:hypothetical protein
VNRGRLFLEFVHILALGMWLGTLGLAGATAGRTFVVMRHLDPALPGYAAFTGEHWSLAAGQVVQPMFVMVEIVQFAAMLIVGFTFVIAAAKFDLSLRRLSTFVRAFVLLFLIAVLSYRFFVLGPGMMQSLTTYWGAAGAGDTQRALEYKSIFDSAHALDRRLMMGTLLLVIGAIGAAGWSILDTGPERQHPSRERELEEPLLARRR